MHKDSSALQCCLEKQFCVSKCMLHDFTFLADKAISRLIKGAIQVYILHLPHWILGNNAACRQFEVLDVAWDGTLGSEALDLLLLDHFAEEFKALHPGLDPRVSPKVGLDGCNPVAGCRHDLFRPLKLFLLWIHKALQSPHLMWWCTRQQLSIYTRMVTLPIIPTCQLA